MSTHSSLTNNAFSFEVFEAGMATNARLNQLTARWQVVANAGGSFNKIEIKDLTVTFENANGDTFSEVIGTVSAEPDYQGAILSFPDLNYVEGTNELVSVVISGTFSYKATSTSPSPSPATEVSFGLLYNSTGTDDGGLLELGGLNDPSGDPVQYTDYNGPALTCTFVNQRAVFIRFGPEKIKFHRFYNRVTATCLPKASLPII